MSARPSPRRAVVLKMGQAAAPGRGLYRLELRDVAAQAESLVTAARQEAHRIITEARRDAAALRELEHQTGHREGYEEGLARGREAGRAEALAEAREQFAVSQASLVSAFSCIIEEFSARRESLYTSARRDVIVLAIAIASRMARKLRDWPPLAVEAAEDACREALEMIGDVSEVRIRAHPADAAAVEQLAADLAASLRTGRHVRMTEDPEVGRGGVILETEHGGVDARVEHRIDRIADELAAGWRARLAQLSIEP